jgi:hypothetical protein
VVETALVIGGRGGMMLSKVHYVSETCVGWKRG